jgi:hypothetical protein
LLGLSAPERLYLLLLFNLVPEERRFVALCKHLETAYRRVCVVLQLEVLIRLVNITQPELDLVAVAAHDLVRFVLLGPLGLPANTQSADVVLAAVRDEYVIKVAKADGAIELVLATLFFSLGIVHINRIMIDALDVRFLHIGADADLVAILHFLVVFNSNLREYSFLLVEISLVGTFDDS